MKIAVISDIHGNMEALNSVLEDINKEKCEQVFCLGDLAMAGPNPFETVDFVRKQNWTIVQGNTDKMISDFSPEILENVKSAFPVMGNALENDVKLLDCDQIEFLKNLLPQKELNIEGVKILLVHGSPRKNNEDILPNLPVEKVEEMIAITDADLIFCGHTHIPCGYQTLKKQTVVNVGSVGRPFTSEPNACYVVLNIHNKEFTIEHKFIDYDREKVAEILKQRNFEGAEKLAQILINPTSRHI